MGIVRLIEGTRVRKTASVFPGNHEYLFTVGRSDPACPGGFWKIDVGYRPKAVSDRTGPNNDPFLFFGNRTNQFLNFTGSLLKTLPPMSSEYFYDIAVLGQEVNLRTSWHIAHNLIYRMQGGAAKYEREELDEGEIREQAYVCYMARTCGRSHVSARAFNMEWFCRVDGKPSRAGKGPFVEMYARLMMLHLSEQLLSGKMTGSFLENRCRGDAGRQHSYNVIYREYVKNNFVKQELKYLMKESTDSMKRARSLCRLSRAKGSMKLWVEVRPGTLTTSLAPDCPKPVIGRKRGLYYS